MREIVCQYPPNCHHCAGRGRLPGPGPGDGVDCALDFSSPPGSGPTRPDPKPKAPFTDLDVVCGDIIFQELALETKPRGGMMMTVKERILY